MLPCTGQRWILGVYAVKNRNRREIAYYAGSYVTKKLFLAIDGSWAKTKK
jgi:hypothetical protein